MSRNGSKTAASPNTHKRISGDSQLETGSTLHNLQAEQQAGGGPFLVAQLSPALCNEPFTVPPANSQKMTRRVIMKA